MPVPRPLRGGERPRGVGGQLLEALGYLALSVAEREALEDFFDSTRMFAVDPLVLHRAVALRQRRRMSLGDSLVAATALVHGLPLATNDATGFKDVPGLRIMHPV